MCSEAEPRKLLRVQLENPYYTLNYRKPVDDIFIDVCLLQIRKSLHHAYKKGGFIEIFCITGAQFK